ncbi:glycosyl transferase [Thermus scotoductus]|uniref:Glycosyl transferase n=1 Tax=Thermus scotoductus TaxID=37636 RepID=A0A430SDP3_THESC|nr:glycosyltransferase family 2 protein [Thermus scotoductus]RTG97870.1 glycosyl transferase [Thermus scotoductus]RTH13010.1 glycosyl transferase [Thermus scotoductus]RTH13881.1 glycosyl transferase [Thermus scotoductus]RTH14809.1 glycosyl transferase [Thermus scotoductus]RTH16628.1 glycosyl transferase [Thermus scotoductus]
MNKPKKPLVSILTPTYNRAYTLPRLYESLKVQTYTVFEWLILDDGSTDNTRQLVDSWLNEEQIKIRYFYQKNSGKHVALNRGIREALGEFFIIVDSDDYLLPHALEFLVSGWESIPKDLQPQFCGIAGLCVNQEGKIVGTPFPENPLDSDYIEIRTRYRIQGDKAEMYRTEVIRNFLLYPEYQGETFVLEALLWNRVAAAGYRMRFFNEKIRVVEYLGDGLTAQGARKTVRNPRGARLYFLEFIQINRYFPAKVLLYHYANYLRFCLHCRIPIRQIIMEAPSKRWLALAAIPGLLVYIRDRFRYKGQPVKPLPSP